jgi:hypothetical protein
MQLKIHLFLHMSADANVMQSVIDDDMVKICSDVSTAIATSSTKRKSNIFWAFFGSFALVEENWLPLIPALGMFEMQTNERSIPR